MDGNMVTGNMGAGGAGSGSGNGYGGNIVVQGPWWTAFGPGGVEGEQPLLEGASFLVYFGLLMLIIFALLRLACLLLLCG